MRLGGFLLFALQSGLKFLSVHPHAVPPFELHIGGGEVMIAASLMSALILSLGAREVFKTDILWRQSLLPLGLIRWPRYRYHIDTEEQMCPSWALQAGLC